MPPMKVSEIGYGMGKKDFEEANCVRVFMGESAMAPDVSRSKVLTGKPEDPAAALGETVVNTDEANDTIVELSCNLDDMTGEAIGFAAEILRENGALDVFTIPVCMKKNRPGVILVCLCEPEKAHMFAKLILKHTGTFGVRQNTMKRYKLDRQVLTRTIRESEIRLKKGNGFGIGKHKPEYEDVAKYAKLNDISIMDAAADIIQAVRENICE